MEPAGARVQVQYSIVPTMSCVPTFDWPNFDFPKQRKAKAGRGPGHARPAGPTRSDPAGGRPRRWPARRTPTSPSRISSSPTLPPSIPNHEAPSASAHPQRVHHRRQARRGEASSRGCRGPDPMERSSNGGSGKPPVTESKAAWRDGAVTYFHLLFYIAISGGQIFFNKASPEPAPSSPSSRGSCPGSPPAARHALDLASRFRVRERNGSDSSRVLRRSTSTNGSCWEAWRAKCAPAGVFFGGCRGVSALRIWGRGWS
jgi:hypothetical protein